MRTNKKTKSVGNGEGTLYYSNVLQRWVFQYVINSKRKTLTQKKNETTKDFKARVTKIKNQLDTGTYIEKRNETFLDILTNHIEQKYNDGIIKDRSYTRNLETLEQIKKTGVLYVNKPIQKITVSDIEQAKNGIREYSKSCIDKIWELIEKTFKIAYSRRMIPYNIMEDETLKKPISKKETKEMEALTINEQAKLEYILNNQERNHKYRNVILLQLYTGMRIGEVLGLTKDCINLKENTLTVYRTLTLDVKNRVILGEHTKTYNKQSGVDKGKRTFPLQEKVRKVIEEILSQKTINIQGALFWDYNNNNFVNTSSINSYLHRINKKYNILSNENDKLSSHKLRHTFITRCQEKGIKLPVLQSMVGHVNGSKITNDIYTSVSIDFMNEELKKVN